MNPQVKVNRLTPGKENNMKNKEKLKLYKISADAGRSWTEQWMTEDEKDSTRMAYPSWLIIESKPSKATTKDYDQAIYKILEKLNDKEREANDCDDESISEQYLAGYLAGLNHARVVLEEEISYIKGGGKYA